MKRVRRTGTAPELAVGRFLRENAVSYRKNVRSLPGSPDFANKRQGWAVFVNGCFWHRHKGCDRGRTPTRNRAFWEEKFAANRSRDARKVRQLRSLGFKVVLLWECQTERRDRLSSLVDRIKGS